MFEPFRQMLARKSSRNRPRLPDGQRVYVIGDIHGRLDLFEQLIEAIEIDDAELPDAETTVILLGDLIDRGPDSAGVVKRARKWQKKRNVRILAGNHEEMFLESFDKTDTLRHFLRHGGRETVLSYGVSRKEFNKASIKELQKLMQVLVPEKDIRFIAGFEDMIAIGDYLFVHAGIDPERSLEEQKPRDMRWIREPFLRHRAQHSHIVVHGHTIFEEIDERKNRIGIDTGAYRFGKLTALVLEGEERRYIQAVEKKKSGKLVIKHKESDR
uniref:metallophosphoesterase family protein n=1 Tax=Parerythrobacter lutipelagi TaxID=1964208 RepID=UPI0010F8C216|nr:metallophosphoesterase family protein [Parerythrobacter lutipelagi]